MLSDFLQRFTIFVRSKYISSLRVFLIDIGSFKLKEDVAAGLQKELKEVLKVYIDVYVNSRKNSELTSKLHLVRFDKGLTTVEAKNQLSMIGFRPANLLETIIFFQEYKDSVRSYLPLIALEVYLDVDKKIGLKNNDLYALSLFRDLDEPKFSRIGELEAAESYEGVRFMQGTFFLAKPF